MKKYFKLLLFFLAFFVRSYDVYGKEIKYELRGSKVFLSDEVLKDMSLDNFNSYIKKEYDLLKETGFNTTFTDISDFISLKITGKFNEFHDKALKSIVKEGRDRSLEVHGSISKLYLDIENNIDEYLLSLNDDSFIKDKVDYIVKFNDKYYLDPGAHEVRDYLINIIEELGSTYKFDGIYLDTMIYPKEINKYTFNDSNSFNTYNEDKLNKEDWRRQNINDFLKILGQKFQAYKKELKFGVKGNYIWRRLNDDVNGIDHSGYSDYDDGAFDSLNIGKMGYVNYIIIDIDDSVSKRDDISYIYSWWEKKLRTYLVDMFISGGENIKDIIDLERENHFFSGFLYKGLDKESIKDKMSFNALVPRFKSYDSYYSLCDFNVEGKESGTNIEFTINDKGYENTRNIVLYKFPYNDVDKDKGEYIKGVYKSTGENTKFVVNKEEGVYMISKLNYNSIENTPNSYFIFNKDSGFINVKNKSLSPEVINKEINIDVKNLNRNNKFKFILNKDSKVLDEIEGNSYSFTPEESGIYTLSLGINKGYDIVIPLFKFNVKDKYVVILDSGHGGEETGAKGEENILEKNINLSISNYVKDLFKDIDEVDIKNTRINDIKIDLSDRSKISSFLNGDIFISIHQNAFDNENANGIESYYYNKEELSKHLCEIIQKNLVNKVEGFDRGVKTANFVVLRENIIPSVLIECGFLTNTLERSKLIDKEYQKLLAEGIYKSIKEYFKLEN